MTGKFEEKRAGYKKTELGWLPEDWELKKLMEFTSKERGNIKRGPFGSSIKKADFVESGYKIYEQKNVIKNNLSLGNYYINEEKFQELSDFEILENDFLISGAGTIGRIILVKKPFEPGIFNQALVRVRLDKSIIDNKFFKYQFESENMQRKIVDNTQGGAMKNLVSMNEFKKVKFLLPPLSEQRKIADILSTVDEKLDVIDAGIRETETLKKGLMRLLLTRGIGHSQFKETELGPIPVEWKIVKLNDITDKTEKYSFTGGPFGSNLKSCHYTESGVRVIQLQNIGDGEFLNNYFIYTSEKKADELISCNIYPGDLIIAKMADPLARACKIPNFQKRYLMCSDGIRLKVNNALYNTDYILYSINSKYFRQSAEQKGTGTTRLRIGLSVLRDLEIIVPPLAEQQKIAEILTTVDEKLDILLQKKESVQTLKTGLMQQLLTGALRVTGPGQPVKQEVEP